MRTVCPICQKHYDDTDNSTICPHGPHGGMGILAARRAIAPVIPIFTRYVAGFMFDEARQNVALIRKAKPVWQAGKLNGIGGKIEDGELAEVAMVREFYEETGQRTPASKWTHFLHMYGINNCGEEGFSVDFFFSTGDLHALRSTEDEPVEIHALSSIHALREDMIENLPWLIALAYDCATDGRPMFLVTHYSLAATQALALLH